MIKLTDILIINLKFYHLNQNKYKQLKSGLHHSFIDKNKHLKKNIHVYMESVAYITSDKVDKLKLEKFHEFLRRYTDIFNKKVTLINKR